MKWMDAKRLAATAMVEAMTASLAAGHRESRQARMILQKLRPRAKARTTAQRRTQNVRKLFPKKIGRLCRRNLYSVRR